METTMSASTFSFTFLASRHAQDTHGEAHFSIMRLPILLAPGADKENAPVIATVRVNAHGVRGLIAVLANPAQTVLILLHCARALHVLKTLHRSLVHAVAGCTAITEVNPVHRIRGNTLRIPGGDERRL
jgi:hypothetical protein